MKQSLLQLNQVSFKIPNLEKLVLDNITYQVNVSDSIVLLGGNGSGKSSLLKLICSHYKPTSGQISFSNNIINTAININSQDIKILTQNCHESLFTTLTVMENYLIIDNKFRNKIRLSTHQKREFFKNYISEFNSNLAVKLDNLVLLLSGGEKQALALALTVLHPPRLLLLDEHTSALDPKLASHIMNLTFQVIKKYNLTCIFITHDLRQALQYGNRILILNSGKIHKTIEDKSNLTYQDLLTSYC